MEDIARILDFWFGELDADGMSDPEHSKRWWKKDPEFDVEIRNLFEADYQAIVAGEREDWLDSAPGALAYVIVLDQFSRNMFRDSPQMYAADAQAVAATEQTVEAGLDRQLTPHQRLFLYMPLMHAESLPAQDRCVALFEGLTQDCEGKTRERVRGNLDFAHRHRDIVAEFGRFPHRNRLLGRDDTPEEAEYLSRPGAGF